MYNGVHADDMLNVQDIASVINICPSSLVAYNSASYYQKQTIHIDTGKIL